MHKIFISYRREDSIETAGRMYDWLDSRLRPDSIFMDVDSLPPGANFRATINDTIASASVVLVIIGSRWLTVREPNGGGPRLDNPDDFVRIEVELAIKYSIPMIPILVQEAKMPSADDLPTSLVSLAYRNAAKVRSNPDFQGDMIRVMKGIESIASDLVFAENKGKASEYVEKAPTILRPDLPPIPEGGRTEYGFYYTKIIIRQIDDQKDNRFNHIIRKEFAFSDSPTQKHEVKAHFRSKFDIFVGFRYELTVTVDSAPVASWELKPNASGRVNEEVRTYGPNYDKSTILNAHNYNVKFRIECIFVNTPGLAKVYHNYEIFQFEVTVDGYTLLDTGSLWN